MRTALRLLTVAALGALCLAQVSRAQAPASAPYRPGLGDLMMSTIQPRHIKLGVAGQTQNWPLAAFELGQMEEAFARVAETWPRWRSVSIADMVELVKEPLAAMQTAIRGRDPQGFTASYGRLTEACNSCHTGAGRPMIVIVAPDAAAYPDQDFAPRSR